MLPFTMDELSEAVALGDVTARRHPSEPLTIYNYSPDTQYRNHWTRVTLACRGLILNDAGDIVARPWEKFFNLGQVNLPIQFDDPVEVMDKADGSLGILYKESNVTKFNGGNLLDVDYYAIATRGSFGSEQAIHATAVWDEKYSHLRPRDGYTLLFEIVYPSNRIVLNYDGMDDLILLGAVENETGFYRGPGMAQYLFEDDYWRGPLVKVMPYKTISEANAHLERDNAEGYVIRSHNFMVKLKQPDYIDLHRLVTNASPKTVWDKLKDGMQPNEVVAAFPDEFHGYIQGMVDPLMEAYTNRISEVLYGYNKALEEISVRGLTSRKDIAGVFKKSKDASYYFMLLDGKPFGQVVWQEIRPSSTKE